MKKKIKNSIKDNKSIKTVAALVFTDQRTQITRAINEDAIQKLCIELVKRVDQDENILCMEQIYHWLGVLPMEFERMCDKSEDLRRAYEFCLMTLSIRRQNGATTGKYKEATINFSMPLYNKKWKDLVIWKADLQSKTAAGYQTINVQMASIPNSDLVPVKKSESVDVGE